MGLPRPGRVVKYLLIINLAAFVLQLILEGSGIRLQEWLGVTVATFYQVWRYVTFQFLHSTASFWHIILNMLGLYFLGTPLEGHWGGRRFLLFYLGCGAAAGLAYVLMGALVVGSGWGTPLIGASGGVYGILLACAVLFPHFRLIFLFFPVPIRLGALILFGIMILQTIGLLSRTGLGGMDGSVWSSIAHLGGAAAAAGYLAWSHWMPASRLHLPRRRVNPNSGAWQRRLQREREDDQLIDDILRKIHDQGIDALTHKEKRLLKDATRRQRERQGI